MIGSAVGVKPSDGVFVICPCFYYLAPTFDHHPYLGKTVTLQAVLETWIEKIHPEDFLNELLITEVFSSVNSL